MAAILQTIFLMKIENWPLLANTYEVCICMAIGLDKLISYVFLAEDFLVNDTRINLPVCSDDSWKLLESKWCWLNLTAYLLRWLPILPGNLVVVRYFNHSIYALTPIYKSIETRDILLLLQTSVMHSNRCYGNQSCKKHCFLPWNKTFHTTY